MSFSSHPPQSLGIGSRLSHIGFDPFDTQDGILLAVHIDRHEENVGDANASTC